MSQMEDVAMGTPLAYHRIPSNDIAQVHRYPDLGAKLEVCHSPMDVLAADALPTLIQFDSGKPVLLAESGAVEPGHSEPHACCATILWCTSGRHGRALDSPSAPGIIVVCG